MDFGWSIWWIWIDKLSFWLGFALCAVIGMALYLSPILTNGKGRLGKAMAGAPRYTEVTGTRRKPVDPRGAVRLVRPLFFWRACSRCGVEVRGETMWRIEADDPTCRPDSYFCCDCMPTYESALKEAYHPKKPKLGKDGVAYYDEDEGC